MTAAFPTKWSSVFFLIINLHHLNSSLIYGQNLLTRYTVLHTFLMTSVKKSHKMTVYSLWSIRDNINYSAQNKISVWCKGYGELVPEVCQWLVNALFSCRHLGSQLAELERVIEKMMEADFVEFATANLNRVAEDELGNEDLVDEVCSSLFL